ncbi:hypothetical protein BKA56DRAFT_600357 [Ilyonectria sp. MPI-CAGE-AT-0026]|nr:hypothetical protein BKA56DRAFT_600357 [Ilyonectria sp. MPI-CAGE-AT-0026]
MSRTFPKTFFTIPTTIYKPDDIIQLGQVIKDPMVPFERLAPPPKLDGKLEPRTSSIKEFLATNRKTKAISVGLLAQVLDSIKGEASAHKSTEETLSWDASEMETRYFEPAEDETFMAKLQANKAVRQWLKKVRFGKSAFVITGLKISLRPGAISCQVYDEAAISAQAKAIIDPQASVQAGAEASAKRSASSSVEGQATDSYVFAYQLRKINVNPLTGRATVGELRKGGDLFGAGDDGSCSDESDSVTSSDSWDEDDKVEEVSLRPKNNLVVNAEDFGPQLPKTVFGKQEVDLGKEGRYLLVSAKASNSGIAGIV